MVSAELLGKNEGMPRIIGGKLVVEMRNRFYILTETDHTVQMIFSCTHFNVSTVLHGGRILLVVQVYDIEKEDEVIMKRFVLRFSAYTVALRFYKYVKKVSSCTNNIIPIDIPDHLKPI